MSTQTLEYDYAVHSAPGAGDNELKVRFFIDAIHDMVSSAKEGRAIYKDCEWIEIKIPGNRDNVVKRPVRKSDIARFPQHYSMFKARVGKNGTEEIVGTLLSAWPHPGMTPARVLELDFYNIRTVENLAAVSDSNGAKLMGLQALKADAIKFLDIAKKAAPIAALRVELKAAQALAERQQAQIEGLLKAQEQRKQE